MITVIILGALLALIIVGAVIGAVFAAVEAEVVQDRSAKGDKTKLKHGWLWALRVALCAVFTISMLGYTWETLCAFGVVFTSLAQVHRRVFNVSMKKPFYYMGPDKKRTLKDSWYDSMAWLIARCIDAGSPVMPYLVVSVVEIGTMVFCAFKFLELSLP